MCQRVVMFLLFQLISIFQQISKASPQKQNVSCAALELSFNRHYCAIKTPIQDINNVNFVDLKPSFDRFSISGILSNFPQNFFVNYPFITSFSLSDSLIKSFTADNLIGAGNLTTLYLTNASFSTLKQNTFVNAPNIKVLSFFTGAITFIESGAFKGLSSLTDLTLQSNLLDTLQVGVFDDLIGVQYIRASYNRLTTIPNGIFNKNVNLTKVEFNSNQIKSLPSGLFFQNLNFYGASFRYNLLQAATTLRAILVDYSFNSIKTVFITIRTRNIFLDGNSLTRINCAHNLSVTGFSAENNSLVNFRCIRSMKNLTSLNLSSNNLTMVAMLAFKKMTSLSEVDLSKNKFKNLWPRVFSTCAKLQTIYCDFFSNYQNLKKLMPKLWRLGINTKSWNCTKYDNTIALLKNLSIYTISNGCTL